METEKYLTLALLTGVGVEGGGELVMPRLLQPIAGGGG